MPPETVIRSRQNPIYKQVRSLFRRDRRHQERAFLVEGPRFIADAIRFGAEPSLIVVAEGHDGLHEFPLSDVVDVRILDDALFATISDTVTSQGMIGIFPFPRFDPEPAGSPFVLVADGVQDPGNLGTLIRSAAGAGASRVVALPGTADPWSPKTVRAAAGAHFLIPIETVSAPELSGSIPLDTTVVAADARADRSYDEVDYRGPIVLAVGAEGRGLGTEMRSLATELVSIPLCRELESLNAAVAGSILLFEAARQRRLLSESTKKAPI